MSSFIEVITDAKTGEVTKRPYTPAEMEVVNADLAERAANAYKEQRAAAYPSIADQLDQIYHDGLDAWKATILAVKQEFPKP
jgi:hypothetical protein